MSKCASKREVLIELRKQLSPEDFKVARASFDNVVEIFMEKEDTKVGDALGLPSPVEVAQEAEADAYANAKQNLIAEINREEPKIAAPKSKSDKRVVKINIKRIEGRTAYYTFPNSDKEYTIEANSKFISLKDKSINEMIIDFAQRTGRAPARVKPNKVLSKEQLDIINKKRNECK